MKQVVKQVLPDAWMKHLLPWYKEFLARTRYRGNAVECPCCKGQFSHFAPVQLEMTEATLDGEQCPRCGSLSRQRLYWQYFTRETALLNAPMAVLHFAPFAWFQQKFHQLPNLHPYVTTDLFVGDIDLTADIMRLPFDDSQFDAIICTHVLEHVDDDYSAMREILRVLKPGAWALLQVPFYDAHLETTYENPAITSPQDRLKHFGQADHVRMYGNDYVKRLSSVGFEVKVVDYRQQFSVSEQQRFGLGYEVLHLCYKPA